MSTQFGCCLSFFFFPCIIFALLFSLYLLSIGLTQIRGHVAAKIPGDMPIYSCLGIHAYVPYDPLVESGLTSAR